MSSQEYPGDEKNPKNDAPNTFEADYMAHIDNLKTSSAFDLVSCGTLETVETLSKTMGFEIFDQFDPNGLHMLHYAARNPDSRVFLYMVTHGLYFMADRINSAEFATDKSIVKLDICVRTRRKEGSAPIHEAARYGNIKVVELLLNLGTPIDLTDNHLKTPLIVATQSSMIHVVIYLISRGANIHAEDEELDNSLHWASYKGSPELINIFLSLGLDVNKPDSFLQTPIHMACNRLNLPALNILLKKNPDLSIRDKKGRTPLDIAKEKQFSIGTRILSYRMGKRGIFERLTHEMTRFTLLRGYVAFFFCFSILYNMFNIFFLHSHHSNPKNIYYDIVYIIILFSLLYYGYQCWKNFTCHESYKEDYQNIFLKQFTSDTLIEFLGNNHICHLCQNVSRTGTIHCIYTDRCVKNYIDYDVLINDCVTTRNRVMYLKFYSLLITYYLLISYDLIRSRRFLLFAIGYLWPLSYSLIKWFLSTTDYFGIMKYKPNNVSSSCSHKLHEHSSCKH